jgi:phage terminase large subunit GpA-like protein
MHRSSKAFLRSTSPDRRPIYEWARDNVADIPGSPIRGRFDIRNSPWLKRPFETLTDPLCRHTTLIAPVQTGKTLLAELAVAYRLANDPGPCSFTFQSDEMAAMEAKTRLMPLLDSIPAVARLLPRPGPLRTQQEIFMGNQFLVLNSANLTHQQSQSIRFKINDELFFPRWSEIYPHAVARVSAFEAQGISHILDISQGGTEGDTAHTSFIGGTQEHWHGDCQSCKKPMPLRFHIVREDKSRAGVVWDSKAKRDDGTYDVGLAAGSARFVCVHCGHEHADSDRTRALWRNSGQYIATTESRRRRSFTYESLVAHSLETLVTKYCLAENDFARIGDENSRINFRQKQEGRFWVVEKNTIELSGRKKSGYLTTTYQNTTVPGEVARIMVCDRQQAGWWVEIGAWTPEPTYRQLYFGKVETRDMLRELQRMYRVDDWAVGQDRGYMPSEVDRDSVAFGWSGIQGAKTKGKRWPMRDQQGQVINVPISDTYIAAVGNGHTAPYIEFDGEWAKDMLSNALAGRGFPYLLPDDFNPLWPDQVASEEKREVRPGVWHWCEVKQNNNHALDCAGMMIAAAMARGVLRFDPNG